MAEIKYFVAIASSLLVLTGCGSSDQNAQIVELKNKVASLEKENAELKSTSAGLLVAIRNELASGNLSAASSALQTLRQKFPESSEVNTANKEVKAALEKKSAEEAKAERVKTLGFVALGTKQAFTADSVKVNVSSVTTTGRWRFDDHGREYTYRESPRGSKFVVLNVSITAGADHDPKLPGFAAYTQNGDKLTKVDEGSYQFVRWMDYGTYLGNGHDFRNDFSRTEKVDFTVGILVQDSDLKRPIFVLATTTGCNVKTTDRFKNPPVSYSGLCPMLKDELNMQDMESKKLVIVKTMNAGK